MTAILFSSASAEDTQRIGYCIGLRAKAGMVFRLRGDLGAGKTCLVQGMARGIGVDPHQPVTSPSYTLIQEYVGRLRLFHVDLYRIGVDDLEDIGFFDLALDSGVLAVEWAERIPENEFPDAVDIVLTWAKADGRRITMTGRGPRSIQWVEGWASSGICNENAGDVPAWCIVE